MKTPDPPKASSAPPAPETCCDMRRKVMVFIGTVLPEQACGIPDTVLADFLRFDLPGPARPDGTTKPVLAFRFCAWCGAPYKLASEIRITSIEPVEAPVPVAESDDESWRGTEHPEPTIETEFIHQGGCPHPDPGPTVLIHLDGNPLFVAQHVPEHYAVRGWLGVPRGMGVARELGDSGTADGAPLQFLRGHTFEAGERYITVGLAGGS